jgi:hypothetical protein
VVVQNASSVSLAALTAIANTVRPSGRAARLLSDVIKNGSVESRMYISAAAAKSDLALGVVVNNPSIQALFNRSFSNKMRFVSFAQNNFGMTVTTAVRLDMTE